MPPDPFPFTFSCCRSGNCCSRPEGRIRLSDAEVEPIAAALALSVQGFRSRYLNPGPDGDWLLRLAPDRACPFLTRVGGLATCEIYPTRPEHCRSFPYWAELGRPGPALEEAMRFCPGLRPRPQGV